MSENFMLYGEDNSALEPYEYRSCGLDGIYLLNGYCLKTMDGEEYVSITNIDGLHEAIGRHLVLNRKALAPKEIRFLRKTMGISQEELASMFGKSSQSVARWEKGETDIPGADEKLLRASFLARYLDKSEIDKLVNLLKSQSDEVDEMIDGQQSQVRFEFEEQWQKEGVAA